MFPSQMISIINNNLKEMEQFGVKHKNDQCFLFFLVFFFFAPSSSTSCWFVNYFSFYESLMVIYDILCSTSLTSFGLY